MVTISAAFLHLDNLVLDYIERRWKIARENILPHTKEENIKATLDITLEEIYFLHFLGSFRDMQSVIRSTQRSNSVVNPPSMQLPLPRFPVEIVEHILEFGSVKQLRRFRCLSRNINNRLCKRLQKCTRAKVNLEGQVRTAKFLDIFKNKMAHLKLPFGEVDFGARNWAALSQVLEIAGSQLVVNLKDFQATELSRDILAKMANVRSLCISGLPNIAEIVSLTDVSLPNLRELELRRMHIVLMLIPYSRSNLSFEHVKTWLHLAPSLRTFTTTMKITVEPAQVIRLFVANASLSKMRFNGMDISWRNGELEVALTFKDNLAYVPAELEWYAPFLRKLYVHNDSSHQLPPFPRLTHLTLKDHPHGLPLPLQLNTTALLQHVTIGSAVSKIVSTRYRDFVFDGVVSLRLSDESWTWTERHPLLFHLIFPNVHTLELSGTLTTDFINYFATHFTHVSNLKFEYFDDDSPWTVPLFQARVRGQQQKAWPFFRFQYLKKLELWCGDGVRNTVLSLVWLTLNKYIQPLQKLHIVTGTVVEHEDGGERSLFYSMRDLNYHKELEFGIQAL